MKKGIIYLKALVWYAIIFFTVDCLALYFEFPFMVEKEFGLKELIKLIVKTLVVGGVFSIILVSIHLKFLSNLGLDLNSRTDLSLYHQKQIKVNISFAELIMLVHSFKDLKAEVKEERKLISLKSLIDVPFYGEKISIKYEPVTAQKPATITIKSHPKNKLTMIDFGKNYSNVKEIEKRITYSIFNSENTASTV